MAEGMGFEPMRELSPPKRLAGARTRPLCDPSTALNEQYTREAYHRQSSGFVKSDTISDVVNENRYMVALRIRFTHICDPALGRCQAPLGTLSRFGAISRSYLPTLARTEIPHLRHSREEPAPYSIRGGNPSPAWWRDHNLGSQSNTPPRPY